MSDVCPVCHEDAGDAAWKCTRCTCALHLNCFESLINRDFRKCILCTHPMSCGKCHENGLHGKYLEECQRCHTTNCDDCAVTGTCGDCRTTACDDCLAIYECTNCEDEFCVDCRTITTRCFECDAALCSVCLADETVPWPCPECEENARGQ